MGLLRFLSVRLVEIIVIVFLIVFMPSIPPKANFTYFNVTSPRNLEGTLALNNRLSGAERLYENELKGPEAFADYNGELYASLFTGEVVKFSKGNIVPVAKFGEPCKGYQEESICGRPLGLKFDKKGNLFVADAYMGVWKVDVKTGKKTLLISMDKEIDGKKPMIPNSIALSENGDIYWTDSSTEFKLEDGVYTLLADATGRVIHYDAKTQKNRVLFDEIHFANGIILSPEEEFLVVAETGRSRLHRYYLKGPKKGTHDIFIDGLPGMPDNLNSDGQGGFLVPLIVARDAENPALTQVIGPLPLLRKFFARIFGLIELGLNTVHKIYPNHYAQLALHWVGHFESIGALMPRRTTILRISRDGEIMNSYHATDGTVTGISEAYIFGDHLYLGSPFNKYVARVPLSKIGLVGKKPPVESVPRTTPPPTTTTRKPVTTTQVPTTTTTTTAKPKTTSTPVKQHTTTTTAPPRTTEAPVKQQAAKQQAATPKSTTEAPRTTQTPTTQAPKTAQPPKAAEDRSKQGSNKQQPQSKTKDSEQPAKVVPVKENTVPKSESIKVN